jgi:superfamily II DNA or RNA helicase
MDVLLDTSSVDDYAMFLKIKSLPKYRIEGRSAWFPDEYASIIGRAVGAVELPAYRPSPWLFDYQRDITATALRKQKFAVFADCGLGKTLIFAEWAKYVESILPAGQCLLWVCPLMVVKQTMQEIQKFYGDTLPIEQVKASELSAWLASGTGRIGITNYDALDDDVAQGRLGAMILDESSMLKSHYGKWGQTCIRLGKGLHWKLAGTGTPAPNDRIEYANHAVFLDHFPTVNSFLARFFVNRGQTDNRWEIKTHALKPFYRSLSHWAIFLTNPATYGWKDNTATLPPINVRIHDVPLTADQRGMVMDTTGQLIVGGALGGITSRSKLGQLAKGHHQGEDVETNKPAYIRGLVESWPGESTIIWCIYNREQERMAETFPDAANIDGDTPLAQREAMIDDFKAGRRKVLISKSKIIGFGLNLQIASRHVFSGLQDSYESYYQCIKRSNRYGSTRALNVHIPITEIERPMIETVLNKAARVQQDTEQQERIFRDASI